MAAKVHGKRCACADHTRNTCTIYKSSKKICWKIFKWRENYGDERTVSEKPGIYAGV